jgi:hypothetical protein
MEQHNEEIGLGWVALPMGQFPLDDPSGMRAACALLKQ